MFQACLYGSKNFIKFHLTMKLYNCHNTKQGGGNPLRFRALLNYNSKLMPFGIGKRFLIDNLKNHVELSAAFITEIEFKTADEK